MLTDSILTQLENQLIAIPGVDRALAQSVARILAFGDSLRPRSAEEKALDHSRLRKIGVLSARLSL